MRRLTFIALLLAVAVGMQAQTAKALIEKYKAMPECEYQFICADSLRIMAEVSGEPAEDIEAMKNIKSVETVQVMLDEEQRAELVEELKRLKGFEELANMAKNTGDDDDELDGENPMKTMVRRSVSHALNPQIKMRVFGKVKKENVTETLVVVDFFNIAFLVHLDGKIAIADLPRVLTVDSKLGGGEIVDVDDDQPKDFNEMVEQASKSCVIAFDDEIQPNLHSTAEAEAYFAENGLDIEGIAYLVGKEKVKEHFPDVDASLVVVYKKPFNIEHYIKQEAQGE